jgi:hypothetical protein
MIREGEGLLKDGDLVVRSSQEFTSQFIRALSRTDKRYSHAGIVFYENGYPMIYHLLAGDENPDERLRKDSLHSFANPRKNFGFAIYRYNFDSSELKKYNNLIHRWYSQGLLFDYSFDLKTEDKMYCSEMIKKALAKATANRVVLTTTMPTANEKLFFAQQTNTSIATLKDREVVAIDNLYHHPACSLVKRFHFITNLP